MRTFFAVFVGGMVGTATRIGLDAVIHHDDSGFPLSTLLINIVGSFVLAFLVSRVWPLVPPAVRAGLGAGVMGGFTTYSAVMASLVSLTASSQPGVAALYLLVTVLGGFAAAAAGLALGARRRAMPLGADE